MSTDNPQHTPSPDDIRDLIEASSLGTPGAKALRARTTEAQARAVRERAAARRAEHPTPVLYLDIDGTVREGKDDPLGRFVNSAADVRVFPAAVTLMRRWKDAGGRIVGVSNQGGIALGHVSYEQVAAAMLETYQQAECLFDRIVYCRHHPAASDPEMARCWCRKPAPGLLIEASLELAAKHGEYYPPHLGLMVGDRDEDSECAKRAGLDFQWAREWRAEA